MGKVKQFYRDTEDALDEPDEAAKKAAAARARIKEAEEADRAADTDRLQKINDVNYLNTILRPKIRASIWTPLVRQLCHKLRALNTLTGRERAKHKKLIDTMWNEAN